MSKLSQIIILVATVGYISAQDCADNAIFDGSACNCKPLFYGLNAQVGGSCTPCPANTFIKLPSPPPPGRFLPQGGLTGQISDCNACTPGTYMSNTAQVSPSPSAAVCAICPDNTFNFKMAFTVGSAADCQFCAQNYYLVAPQISVDKPQAKCAACQPGVGTPAPLQYPMNAPQDEQKCNICLDGYYMTAKAVTGSSPQAAKCSQCPPNSTIPGSNTINTIASCQCYDANANPLSDSVQTCTCKTGYGGNPSTHSDGSNGCTACLEGQFSSNGSPCTTCAKGSSISQDQHSCACTDSSEGVASWSASTNKCQCSPNYYGDPSQAVQGTTGSCQRCPTGKTSPAGTTSISGCIDPSSQGSSQSGSNSNGSPSQGGSNSNGSSQGGSSQNGSSSQGQNGQTETNSTQNISKANTSNLTISLILLLSICFLN